MARKCLRMAICLFVGALAAACDNTRDVQSETERVKQDAERAAERVATEAEQAADKVAVGAERAAERLAASAATAQVKTALMADGRVDASRINVDTSASTMTVMLKGSVTSEQQKTMAEQIARERAEGYTIDNQLVVATNQPGAAQ